jgi:hypothetical protein
MCPMTERDSNPADGGLLVADETAACPVCSGPAQQDVCPRCGWTLFTGYQLGGVTEADLRAFDERLARAQRQHHLGYAALAAGYPGRGDPVRLRRLAAVLTGAPPDEAELRAARETAQRLAAASAEADSATDPAPGTLIDIDVAGLTRTTWEPGDGGPVEHAAFTVWPWRSLLDGPADADALALALASGRGLTVGELSGLRATAATIAADSDAVPPLFACDRLVGWAVPRELLAALRETRPVRLLAPSRRDQPAAIAAPGRITAVAAVARADQILVASGGAEGEVRLQATDGMTTDANGAHRGRVTALALAEDAGLVISGGRDGVVLSWGTGLAAGARELLRLSGRLVVTHHQGWVTAVRMTAGQVYSLADDGWLDCSVRGGGDARDGRDWRTRFTTGVGLDCSLALAVTADGGQAAVAGNGGRVRLMNGATGDLIRWIDVGAPVSALAMTAQAVAAATPRGVLVYDLDGQARGGPWRAGGEVSCLDAEGEVASGDADGFVRVFQAPGHGRAGRPGDAVLLFAGRHPAAVRAVRLLGGGRLVSADVNGLIRVWSYRAGD